MPRQRAIREDREVSIDWGTVSPKQDQFLEAKTFFVCYGGARGGGKSHVVRLKAVGMCMRFEGIRILMVRCHYNELEENLVRPILNWVPEELYSYNNTSHILTFRNGSVIKFGHYDGDDAEHEYQGLEYDVVFIDEATQLSERAFNILQGCIRGVNDFPKRMYLTCNPGGVGHRWVKRLFIDRNYRNDPNDPERNENPEDYTFIFATVEDNEFMLKSSPRYLQQLANMPEDIRRAWRYGDWDALGGNYFKEFAEETHTMKPFKIPDHWPRYRSFDYGLDMFACFWWAVDEDGRSWCYREYEHSDLIVQAAAAAAKEHTLPGEKIQITYAPPDVWNRQKDTGKAMAQMFMENGLPIVKADNNRVQGHMIMKDMLSGIPLNDPYVKSMYPMGKAPKTLPALMFFSDLGNVIGDIRDIQADENNPNDCAKQPHDITHTVDGIRYYCISRTLAAEAQKKKDDFSDIAEEAETAYQDYMCGGSPTASYMGF